ncbi:MAG TPA: Smr/MutS family protein [Gemmatimonadales bacterium]|jgi:DNA-nicking Smr family endonuclease
MSPARDPFDPLDGPITDELDLHRMTAPEAKAAVTGFVRRAPKGALLHVITGKGRNSAGGPVLRNTIRAMLRAGSMPQVRAWASDDNEGGFLIRIAN